MSFQLTLKYKLIDRQISKQAFLDELTKLDQATNDHKDCLQNISILEGTDIREIFMKSESSVLFEYYNCLRNFLFHAFQLNELDSSAVGDSVVFLEKAAKLTDELRKIDPNEPDLFATYISATFCYMKKDLEGLKKFLDVLENSDTQDPLFDNVKVIRRLYAGLSETGEVDYKRDY